MSSFTCCFCSNSSVKFSLIFSSISYSSFSCFLSRAYINSSFICSFNFSASTGALLLSFLCRPKSSLRSLYIFCSLSGKSICNAVTFSLGIRKVILAGLFVISPILQFILFSLSLTLMKTVSVYLPFRLD